MKTCRSVWLSYFDVDQSFMQVILKKIAGYRLKQNCGQVYENVYSKGDEYLSTTVYKTSIIDQDS